MDKMEVVFDREGNTLNVWLEDPSLEHSCEETGEEVILVKDKSGRVIGFEKLNYVKDPASIQKLGIESSVS